MKKKPRILFLNLGFPGLVSKKTYKIHLGLPPLDLIYLHSIAQKNGLPSLIADRFAESKSDLSSRVREADWIVATTTPYHMWQCPNSDWDWLRNSLGELPAEKLVVYGLHGTVFPEIALRQLKAHALIRREPEVVFQQFLEKGDWRVCDGISYLLNEQYVENPLPKLPDMNSLIASHYDVDIKNYAYFLLGKNTGIFESSRGCPWKCNFCDQEMHSWTYRKKDPAIFAEEVSAAIEKTGMQTAYFYDMEFTISPKHTFAVTEELRRRNVHKNLRWTCQTRADMVDQESLQAMREAGCELIHFGVESANPKILQETNKKITLEKIQHGVRLAKQAGIQTACFFMFGLPEESPEQFPNTLEFARKLNPTYASFHFAIPFPGTPLYQRYIEEGRAQWGDWPSTYFNGWTREEIAAYIKRAYVKFYLVPKRIDFREFSYRSKNLGSKLDYFLSL